MSISAILQFKKDYYLIISPQKFKIKRSKDRKMLFKLSQENLCFSSIYIYLLLCREDYQHIYILSNHCLILIILSDEKLYHVFVSILNTYLHIRVVWIRLYSIHHYIFYSCITCEHYSITTGNECRIVTWHNFMRNFF